MSTHWIGGINAVSAALEHEPQQVREVMVAGKRNERVEQIVALAEQHGIAVRHAKPDALQRITGLERHQGVAANYTMPPPRDERELPELIEAAGSDALLLVLDGVQDPHNLGACLRSAAAAGVTALIVPRDRAVGMTPTVRKVAAGAADRVPLFSVTNLARTLKQLQKSGVWLTGLAGEADRSLYDIDLKGPVALVMGGESDGLRRLTAEHCDHLARIPMAGDIESLNVSVATGIALFEARRQRG